MGWEIRGSGRYYYRKRREGRRVVSEYVSHSMASLIEVLDTEERNERKQLRRVERVERERLRAAGQEVDEFGEWVGTIVQQTLLDNGFHQHKGEWRKKRNG